MEWVAGDGVAPSDRLARAWLLKARGKRNRKPSHKSPLGQLGPRDAACSVVGPMDAQRAFPQLRRLRPLHARDSRLKPDGRSRWDGRSTHPLCVYIRRPASTFRRIRAKYLEMISSGRFARGSHVGSYGPAHLTRNSNFPWRVLRWLSIPSTNQVSPSRFFSFTPLAVAASG